MKSFAAKTRDVLAREDGFSQEPSCCIRAELIGFAFACGMVTLAGGGAVRLTMRTEHPGSARRMVKILRREFQAAPGVRIVQAARLGGRTTFEIRVDQGEVERVLRSLGFSPLSRTIPRPCLKKKCCRAAFLRGVFLGCGTLTDPERGYQMEFVFPEEQTAQTFRRFLGTFCQIQAGIAERKGIYVVYMRSGEEIISALSLIGAHAAIMEMENVRIVRDARNRANRATNCDSGNITKMLAASDRQMKAIALIEATIGLSALPEPLREIAVERKLNADASLEALGAMLTPPVGKSGVHHRLSRIEAIAQSIEKQRE